MGRRVRVIGVRKQEPDVGLYVLALIALARQLQEEEERAARTEEVQQPPVGREEPAHD